MGEYRIELKLEHSPSVEAVADYIRSSFLHASMDCKSIRVINTGVATYGPQPLGAHGEHRMADGAAAGHGDSGKWPSVEPAPSVAGAGPASLGEPEERVTHTRYDFDLEAAIAAIERTNVSPLYCGPVVYNVYEPTEKPSPVDMGRPLHYGTEPQPTPKHAGAPAPAKAGAVPDAPVHSDNAGAVGASPAGNGGAGFTVKANNATPFPLIFVSRSNGVSTYCDKLGRIWHCIHTD